MLISPNSEHFICPLGPRKCPLHASVHRAHPSSRPSLCECAPPAGPANRRISWLGVSLPCLRSGPGQKVWCTLLDAWTFCTQAICSQVVAFANGQRHDCDLDGELVPSVDERLAELLFRCINSTSTLASGSPTTFLHLRVPSAPS